MAPNPDYFDGINFDRHWEEEDWERFFDAQDRLTSDRLSMGLTLTVIGKKRTGNASLMPKTG